MQLPELLLIDKPTGITSFDVIRVLRRQTGIKKFGHAGTLDPMASGLMLLGVEQGTKRLAELVKLDKEYVAEIRIGERRTTGDLEGEIVEQVAIDDRLTSDIINEALQSLVGTHELPVSAYSAIKKDGVPMYKRARAAAKRGETIADVPVRAMTVFEAELLSTAYSTIDRMKMLIVSVRFSVASGVYIRSLAEELGSRLDYPATLQALRRTKVGKYRIEDALQLSAITKE